MGVSSVRGTGSAAGVLLLGAVVALAGACDSGGGTEPPPAEQPATIQVTVTADGSAQQGVAVSLFEAGAASAAATRQTGSNGVAEFTNLAAGSYAAEVTVPSGLALADGETARKTVSVSAGATASVAISLVTAVDSDPDVVEIHLTATATFSPSQVTIAPGTTVRWINDSDTFHTVTPDGHSQWSRAELDDEDEVFTHTFDQAGDFDYFCEPHESVNMVGSITVSADG